MRPSPGSENVSPSSGVPTRIVDRRDHVHEPDRGAAGRPAAAAARRRTPARTGCPQRCRRPPPRRSRAAAASRSRAARSRRPETTKLARMIAGRSISRPPSGREITPRNSTRPPASPATCSELAARAVQQRHDPVADDDGEPERRGVHRGSGSSRRSTTVGSPRATGARAGSRGASSDEHERRPRRRSPPSRTAHATAPQRHEREREPAAGHAHRAVDSLRDRRADRRAHVLAARDERRGGADAGDEAHRRSRTTPRASRAPPPTRTRRSRARPPPTSRGPKRSQSRPIGTCSAACVTKSAGREQPDDREPDAVRVRRRWSATAPTFATLKPGVNASANPAERRPHPHRRDPIRAVRAACGRRASSCGCRRAASSTTSPIGSASSRRTTSGSCGTPSAAPSVPSSIAPSATATTPSSASPPARDA